MILRWYLFSILLSSYILVVCGIVPTIPQQISIVTTGRRAFSSVVVNDNIFIIGGFNLTTEQPVGRVDVYSLEGAYLYPLSSPLPTPRGNMTMVLLNETFVLTIGGSQNSSGENPLTSVEALDLSISEPEWVVWGNLSVPRLNALSTIGFGGVVVTLGVPSGYPIDYFYSTEWIDPSTTMPSFLPRLPSMIVVCNGALGEVDYTTVALICVNPKHRQPDVYLLNEASFEWSLLSESPFIPLLGIHQVDSQGHLFVGQTANQDNLLFLLNNGTIGQYSCLINSCTGVRLWSTETWVCSVSSNSTEVIHDSVFLSNKLQDSQEGWPMYGGNARHTFTGVGGLKCTPTAISWSVKVFSGYTLVLGDGKVFFIDDQGNIVATTPSGTVIWKTLSSIGSMSMGSLVYGGSVLYAMFSGHPLGYELVVVDSETGEASVIMTYQNRTASPIAIGPNGTAFYVQCDSTFQGCSLSALLWEEVVWTEGNIVIKPTSSGLIAPVVVNGSVYLVGNNTLFAVDCLTGTFQQVLENGSVAGVPFQLIASNESTLFIQTDTFQGSYPESTLGVDLLERKVIWTLSEFFPMGYDDVSGLLIGLYYATSENKFHHRAVDATGQTIWTINEPNWKPAGALTTIGSDRLFYTTVRINGVLQLCMIFVESGIVGSCFPTTSTNPIALSPGTLYTWAGLQYMSVYQSQSWSITPISSLNKVF